MRQSENFAKILQQKKDMIVSEKTLKDMSCVVEATLQIIDFCDCVFTVFKWFS